jgi:glycosyltransferase involved in cell wall biosynthesis
VTWAGEIGPIEIARRLASADLYVWPALNEAFGMAPLEAQASGVPVVAGIAGGVSEIVVDGVTGLLVPPSDVTAFARAVRSLLVDRPRRYALAEAARHRVRAEHDISSAARRLNAVFDVVSPGSWA